MTASIASPKVYQQAEPKIIQFPPPSRQAYRMWSDEDLETECRLATDLLATLIEEGLDVEFASLKRDELHAERDRRRKLAKRFKNTLNGPRWQPGTGAHQSDLIEFAQELKGIWPIDRFLTEMMMIDLKPTSRGRWQCRCFTGVHQDQRPSMTVYGDTNRVFCHACRYSGDVFDITRLHFGLNSFSEAVRRVADATSGMGIA